MQALLWPLISWVFRAVVVRFVILAVLYEALVILVPIMLGYLTPFISASSLTSLFSALPASMLWFMWYLRLDFGLPLLISAWLARFLIRRIPMIG